MTLFVIIRTYWFYQNWFYSAIFYQIFISYQMITLQKIWKMFFILSKNLFSFWRYSSFCIFVFRSFSPVSHCFGGWSKKNFEVYDVISCLSNNLRTHFVWYLEKEIRWDIETLSIIRVSNKEHFYLKSCTKCASTAIPRPLFNFELSTKTAIACKKFF